MSDKNIFSSIFGDAFNSLFDHTDEFHTNTFFDNISRSNDNDVYKYRTSTTTNVKFPLFNVYRENGLVNIQLSLAGYKKSEIGITLEGKNLSVFSKNIEALDITNKEFKHNGFNKKEFNRQFTVSPNSEVRLASLVDGILHIKLDENDETIEIKTIEIE